MPDTSAWDDGKAREIVVRLAGLEGATLPILHALQDAFGFIHESATDLIAEALNLSRAEAHGVITFYHDFRRAPAGRRMIQICRAEACQANGCEDVVAELRSRHGVDVDKQNDDRLTIQTVYCLGNCALGPSALVDGELVGRLDAERLAGLCAGTSLEQAQIASGATR